MRFGKGLVQKRFGPEHAEVRQCTAGQQHTVGSDKAKIANSDWRRRLPILLEIDAMGKNLRLKSGHGGEVADRDRVRAIDEMPMGNGGVFAQN